MQLNKVELIISLLALIVAAWALIISIESNNATIRHNELSVTPILQFGHTVSPNEFETLNFRVKNVGLGPAIIENVTFIYNDHNVTKAGSIELKNALPNLPIRLHTKAIEPKQVIPAGQTYYLFKAVDKGEVSVSSTLMSRQFFENFCLSIEYRSIYFQKNHLKSRGC